MSLNRCHLRSVVMGVIAAACVAVCSAADQGVIFRSTPASAPASSEVVSVFEPAGGQFTYSVDGKRARPGLRFAIGSAPRTDFVAYSAEEQVALEELRQRLMGSAAASSPAAAVRPASPPASRPVTHPTVRTAACAADGAASAISALAWPRVVRDERHVCVPKLEYAEQADWRDHMWCFDKGDGNVR